MVMKLCGQTNKACAHPVLTLKKQIQQRKIGKFVNMGDATREDLKKFRLKY